MRERNMLIRTDRGPGVLTLCRGPETYFDATNPDARAFVWDRIQKNYYAYGVRNFWLDESEPEIWPYDYDNLRYCEGNGLEVSNLYPFYYAKAFYDGQRAAGQGEILNLIRCAFLGSQRFGVVLWTGDIRSDFDSLRRQIKAGLNVSLCGMPWWTTDIGGFHGGDRRDVGLPRVLRPLVPVRRVLPRVSDARQSRPAGRAESGHVPLDGRLVPLGRRKRDLELRRDRLRDHAVLREPQGEAPPVHRRADAHGF